MSRIDRSQPITIPLARSGGAAPAEAAPAPSSPTQPTDAIKISVDARVKLGEDKKPKVVLEDVEVDGVDVGTQVDANMKGRRKGLRDQVTQAVVKAVAEQVATAIAPMLEQKLEDALKQEQLPPSLAHDLADQTVPELSKIVARRLAEQVKVSYKLGF
jgi:hypothetical protein